MNTKTTDGLAIARRPVYINAANAPAARTVAERPSPVIRRYRVRRIASSEIGSQVIFLPLPDSRCCGLPVRHRPKLSAHLPAPQAELRVSKPGTLPRTLPHASSPSLDRNCVSTHIPDKHTQCILAQLTSLGQSVDAGAIRWFWVVSTPKYSFNSAASTPSNKEYTITVAKYAHIYG